MPSISGKRQLLGDGSGALDAGDDVLGKRLAYPTTRLVDSSDRPKAR
jgi:hypothetical protein